MVTVTRNFSLSIHTTIGFKDCLAFLKQSLFREGFQIIAEVPFHRAFEKYLGLRENDYVVLIVWNPFQAYRALLADRDAGLLVPFHLVVADEGKLTRVTAPNHDSIGSRAGSIVIEVLARDLNKQVWQIFAELAAEEKLEVNLRVQEAKKEAS